MKQPFRIEDLPTPPADRVGFPWTAATPTLPTTLPNGAAYPKISVITPSYKQGQYLEETIRSVLLQGYPNLEYIIIDGGSPDNSVEIIEKYAPFLKFWVSEPDSGQANAINKGFAVSTGDIMGWLNSDDTLLPNALYRIACTFVEKPEVQLITGLRKKIDEQSNFTGNFVQDRPTNYYLRHYCCIAQETTYWRRAVWNHLGSLDETLHFAMDYEYWLRAINHGYSFHFTPHYLGQFRDYAQNKTNSWLDVYRRDMNTLYRQYNMGESEGEIHAKLGRRWARRYGFYTASGKQAWTNSPRLILLIWWLLEIPLLADIFLSCWQLFRLYRTRHHTQPQTPPKALLATLVITARATVRSALVDRSPLGWGDIRMLPDLSDIEANPERKPMLADSISFGKGWHSTAFYRGAGVRWSSGIGEIFLLNATNSWKQLRLAVTPATHSHENVLELVDEQGKQIGVATVNRIRTEVRFVLPPVKGDCIKYELRWGGPIIQPSDLDNRSFAFRLEGIEWLKL